MGGLGPGIGGFEILVIGLVALLVVGPKDLPMLMRKVGQFVAKARGMANEFRANFDEMARQTELDDLRKEVEALRTNQGAYGLGEDADAAFKDIRTQLEAPLDTPEGPATPDVPVAQIAEPIATGTDEWPDTAPDIPKQAVEPVAPVMAPKPKARAKPKAKTAATAIRATKPVSKAASSKVAAAKASAPKPAAAKSAPSKPRAARSKKVDL